MQGINFAVSVEKFSKKTKEVMVEETRVTAQRLFTKIINKTPVETGSLKANWQTSLRMPAYGVVEGVDKDGSIVIAKMLKVTNDWDGDGEMIMVNHAPYAVRIEYGYSKHKAPNGMVRTSILEMAN